MNILIADDEKLTRDGLIFGISWNTLGFEQVESAADGIHALELCEAFVPDILLTDVRMPRMDGISLAQKLQKKNPDMAIIFMSGYSDKEYLKAAIKLKAVSYIEKPINLQELTQALTEASAQVAEHAATRRLRFDYRSHSNMDIAVALTSPNALKLSEINHLPVQKKGLKMAFTVLLRFYTTASSNLQSKLQEKLSGLFYDLGLTWIHGAKQPSVYVLQIFSYKEISPIQMNFLVEQMCVRLKELCVPFHLIIGSVCNDIEILYESYNNCILGLQRVFFQPLNSALIYTPSMGTGDISDLDDWHFETALRSLLADESFDKLKEWADLLLKTILQTHGLMPALVRELYFRLLSEVYQSARLGKIDLIEERGLLWESIASCPNIYALQDLLLHLTEKYYQAANQRKDISSPIYMIQNYIQRHLSDQNLSIKTISDDAHLSNSYVCTLFKSETGITLTHYITELRMKKARELLKDPRNRVSEISTLVGFSDSNYFSKAFKKAYGLSPTEFRDSIEKKGKEE